MISPAKIIALLVSLTLMNLCCAQQIQPRHLFQAGTWRADRMLDSLKLNDTLCLTTQADVLPYDIIFSKHKYIKQLTPVSHYKHHKEFTRNEWTKTGGWFGWYLPLTMEFFLKFPKRKTHLKLKPVSDINTAVKFIVIERDDVTYEPK